MDLVAAKAAGISFMTHKIGEGTSYTDAKFGTFYKRAKAAGIPLLGAYYVNHNGDQNAQADRMLTLLDSLAPGWRNGPFLLQIDAERWADGTPTPAEVETFAHRLLAKAPQCVPFIYGPKWVYGDRLKGAGVPLWASNYGSNPAETFKAAYPGDKSDRWAAYSGQVPAVLQYASKTTIATQHTCDANAFRGTLAELVALTTPKGEDDVTPAELTAALKAEVPAIVAAAIKAEMGDIERGAWHIATIADQTGKGDAVSPANALETTRNAVVLGFQAVKADLAKLAPGEAVDLDALAEKVVTKLAERLSS
jgi:GH25 family lysozyme M1 (1,4-beta-N-acetylmuramidase)